MVPIGVMPQFFGNQHITCTTENIRRSLIKRFDYMLLPCISYNGDAYQNQTPRMVDHLDFAGFDTASEAATFALNGAHLRLKLRCTNTTEIQFIDQWLKQKFQTSSPEPLGLLPKCPNGLHSSIPALIKRRFKLK